MYCSQLLKYRAVTSQEQVAALAGIITYVTFQIEYCIKNLMCTVYLSEVFLGLSQTFSVKNSAFRFCGSYYFMAALA